MQGGLVGIEAAAANPSDRGADPDQGSFRRRQPTPRPAQGHNAWVGTKTSIRVRVLQRHLASVTTEIAARIACARKRLTILSAMLRAKTDFGENQVA